MYKSILSLYLGEEKEASVLQAAFALAKDFASHVKCLHISPDAKNTSYSGFGFTGVPGDSFISEIEHNNKFQREKAEREFCKFEAKEHVSDENFSEGRHVGGSHASAVFINSVGYADRIIRERGKFTDLIIIGQIAGKISADYSNATIAAIFDTGKPVLLTPSKNISTIGYNVTIAWNNSVQAARAVTAAIPLLQQAKTITAVTVKKKVKEEKRALSLLKDYLKAHDINITAVLAEKKGSSSATILREVRERKSDLLIMGAFSHNKFRQMIIGGVTSHMIDNANIPVFLTH